MNAARYVVGVESAYFVPTRTQIIFSYSHHERNRQESVVDGGEVGSDPVVQPQPERKHDEHQTLNIKVHLAMSATSRIR